MLHLKQRLLAAVRAAAPLPAATLHRLSLSATSVTRRPARFVPEEYLVATCGLTPAQARKSAKYLSRLRSPVRPDAVRAFLAGIGLTEAGVAAAVVSYPPLLSSNVDQTLTPRFAQLREIGLSPPQISRLITISPEVIFSPVKISRLAFYLSFLGSYDRVHAALKRSNNFLLRQDVERVVRPNIAFLQHCGLSDKDIGKHFLQYSKMLLSEPEHVKQVAVRVEELGVPRNSGMFKHALVILYGLTPENVNAKLDFLKKLLGCSEAELGIAVRKMPSILAKSEGKIGRMLEFLMVEIGLQPSYILQRPALFGYSIERRLMPRHFVTKVVKAKANKEIDFYYGTCLSEKSFVEKFVVPYEKIVPGLIDAYAAACTGQVPPELQL